MLALEIATFEATASSAAIDGDRAVQEPRSCRCSSSTVQQNTFALLEVFEFAHRHRSWSYADGGLTTTFKLVLERRLFDDSLSI